MKTYQLLWKEIRYRSVNFLLAAGTVTLAVMCSVALVLLVNGYQAHTRAQVADLDDEIRKDTKGLGFNINILPQDQNLADFHANDFGEKTMPQEFVQRLADSRDIVTINHLRAALIRKVTWQEHQREVILMGVTGVVPWTHRTNKKQPLSEAVPPGKLNVGHVLAEQLGLRPEQTVKFRGREFAVHKVYEARGSKDDITVWIDLAAAQEMLALPGQINLIQALECNCASVDRLADIEQEIAGVLGGEVQVIELATKAIARARARENVRLSGEQTLATLRRFTLYGFLFTTLVASLIVALLSLLNASQRRREIGILRAIGTPLQKILVLFLGKAALLGLVGALSGYLLGLGLASLVGHATMESFVYPAGVAIWLLVAALLATPLLTILASWIPALLVSGQDPAAVLRNE